MHLRRVARALLTRRAASRAYVASASRSEKQPTGIVGLDVLDGAKAAYRAAIAADPGYTQLAHYNLGYLLMKETLRKYCFSCSFSRQRKVSPGKWVHDAAQVLATLPGI